MHDHWFGERRDESRPRGARIDDEFAPHLGRLAAHGRSDPLGPGDVLDLQRTAGNAGVTAMLEEEPSSVHDVISSGGRPLEPDVRTDMESRLGADFGDVRVHDDTAAASSATAVNARAYTVGADVVFQRGTYDPSSTVGRTTLAHELTHVVQQRNGPVDGTSAPGGIKVSDPGDRFEREAVATADRVMGAAGPVAQRQDADREAAATDSSSVQREAEDQEEDTRDS